MFRDLHKSEKKSSAVFGYLQNQMLQSCHLRENLEKFQKVNKSGENSYVESEQKVSKLVLVSLRCVKVF